MVEYIPATATCTDVDSCVPTTVEFSMLGSGRTLNVNIKRQPGRRTGGRRRDLIISLSLLATNCRCHLGTLPEAPRSIGLGAPSKGIAGFGCLQGVGRRCCLASYMGRQLAQTFEVVVVDGDRRDAVGRGFQRAGLVAQHGRRQLTKRALRSRSRPSSPPWLRLAYSDRFSSWEESY